MIAGAGRGMGIRALQTLRGNNLKFNARNLHVSSHLLQRTVRPQVPSPENPQPADAPRPVRPRIGLLFLLMGACLATWLIKPNHKPPIAAFDPVKRKVCILFVFGTPTPAEIKTLQDHGFEYITLDLKQSPEKQLQQYVSSGKTWLAIASLPQNLSEFEKAVVQCDLALDFNSKQDLSVLKERLQPVDKPLAEILDTKNM